LADIASDPLAAWRGPFGDNYTDRNRSSLLPERVRFWARVLGDLRPRSILEVGAGDGSNLRALSAITEATLMAVEPNRFARNLIPFDCVVDGTAQSMPLPDGAAELVFTCGVLIHVNQPDLPAALDEIYRVSARYIACAEYFSAEPREQPYRGQNGLLFLRDFGAAWLDRFPDLSVVDNGFAWRKTTGLDNLTWTLFRKE